MNIYFHRFEITFHYLDSDTLNYIITGDPETSPVSLSRLSLNRECHTHYEMKKSELTGYVHMEKIKNLTSLHKLVRKHPIPQMIIFWFTNNYFYLLRTSIRISFVVWERVFINIIL